MKFHHSKMDDTPEMNFIPLIDVLLVILIFLMVTTTYSKFTQLEINLPTANTSKLQDNPQDIIVLISATGRFSIDGELLSGVDTSNIVQALTKAVKVKEKAVILISADAQASHQSVMRVLEAAQQANLNQITFATQADGV